MTSVTLDNVSKTYGDSDSAATIMMDVTVESGEFFTLLGPSGCGKSTMLRMIAGFIAPTSGRVWFGGEDVTATPPHRRGTGMVFQNYALFPHMSVAQNVAYGLTSRRVPKADKDRRVDEVLRNVGLTGYGERRIDQLSGGQQQRVALARAVVLSPSVLLLDEPLSNLDAKLREETRLQIREVQQAAKITALYVTHDQAEAMSMSDRIAVLEGGRVHQVAAPREVYLRPATEFVARFIGNSNVLPATFVEMDGALAVVEMTGGKRVGVEPPPSLDMTKGGYVGVSVRPEAMRLDSASQGLNGRVSTLEYTGASVVLDVLVGDLTIKVTAPDHSNLPVAGDDVSLGFDPDRAWLVTP